MPKPSIRCNCGMQMHTAQCVLKSIQDRSGGGAEAAGTGKRRLPLGRLPQPPPSRLHDSGRSGVHAQGITRRRNAHTRNPYTQVHCTLPASQQDTHHHGSLPVCLRDPCGGWKALQAQAEERRLTPVQGALSHTASLLVCTTEKNKPVWTLPLLPNKHTCLCTHRTTPPQKKPAGLQASHNLDRLLIGSLTEPHHHARHLRPRCSGGDMPLLPAACPAPPPPDTMLARHPQASSSSQRGRPHTSHDSAARLSLRSVQCSHVQKPCSATYAPVTGSVSSSPAAPSPPPGPPPAAALLLPTAPAASAAALLLVPARNRLPLLLPPAAAAALLEPAPPPAAAAAAELLLGPAPLLPCSAAAWPA